MNGTLGLGFISKLKNHDRQGLHFIPFYKRANQHQKLGPLGDSLRADKEFRSSVSRTTHASVAGKGAKDDSGHATDIDFYVLIVFGWSLLFVLTNGNVISDGRE